MTYLLIFAIFLGLMVVFFVGMAFFLIMLAYVFSFFTGKKINKSLPPKTEKPPLPEEKPLKIA